MASGCRSTRTSFHVGTPASVVSAEASWPASCSARASSPRYLHGCSLRESGGRVSVRIAIRRDSMAQPCTSVLGRDRLGRAKRLERGQKGIVYSCVLGSFASHPRSYADGSSFQISGEGAHESAVEVPADP